MTGYIHSEETFGTVDGPGIRYVLFMQGCPLRCKYCHNPDTWTGQGRAVTVEEILAKFEKNRAFYSKGGITVSGGEPLLQVDFLIALFAAAKERGIHTCIDTSGITFQPRQTDRIDALLQYTDLVMLDIKHIDPVKHKSLTGADNANILAFARHLGEKGVKLWVRHVVVPELTDDSAELADLGCFLATLPTLKALDVIPYHTMGVPKYRQLGLEYPLEGIPALDRTAAMQAKEHILAAFRNAKKNQH